MTTHLNSRGMPHMVDVGHKPTTRRRAVAQGTVLIPLDSEFPVSGGEWLSPKGPVFQTAIIAGIQAAKDTSRLIPLCHPLPLTHCDISITPRESRPTSFECGDTAPPSEKNDPSQFKILELLVICTAETTSQTGVEMEALTGVAVACLTIYDMGKSMAQGISIRDVQLVSKSGGSKKT